MNRWKSLLMMIPCVACSSLQKLESPSIPSRIRAHTLRLKPGQGLTEELQAFAKSQHLRAGAILTTVAGVVRKNEPVSRGVCFNPAKFAQNRLGGMDWRGNRFA